MDGINWGIVAAVLCVAIPMIYRGIVFLFTKEGREGTLGILGCFAVSLVLVGSIHIGVLIAGRSPLAPLIGIGLFIGLAVVAFKVGMVWHDAPQRKLRKISRRWGEGVGRPAIEGTYVDCEIDHKAHEVKAVRVKLHSGEVVAILLSDLNRKDRRILAKCRILDPSPSTDATTEVKHPLKGDSAEQHDDGSQRTPIASAQSNETSQSDLPTIRFSCQCSAIIRAPTHLSGKTCKCPKCGKPVVVPFEEVTSEET